MNGDMAWPRALLTCAVRALPTSSPLRRLDTYTLLTVFRGVYPVFDASVTYSVSMSKSCAGALLGDDAYVVWYRATDIYGSQSPAMPTRATMTP